MSACCVCTGFGPVCVMLEVWCVPVLVVSGPAALEAVYLIYQVMRPAAVRLLCDASRDAACLLRVSSAVCLLCDWMAWWTAEKWPLARGNLANCRPNCLWLQWPLLGLPCA